MRNGPSCPSCSAPGLGWQAPDQAHNERQTSGAETSTPMPARACLPYMHAKRLMGLGSSHLVGGGWVLYRWHGRHIFQGSPLALCRCLSRLDLCSLTSWSAALWGRLPTTGYPPLSMTGVELLPSRHSWNAGKRSASWGVTYCLPALALISLPLCLCAYRIRLWVVRRPMLLPMVCLSFMRTSVRGTGIYMVIRALPPPWTPRWLPSRSRSRPH